MTPRKRRRDQAFLEDETGPQPVGEEEAALDEKRRAEKEQEVWDAIREAHYEAIEQLPLTLQRQLSLMRKLDDQSIALTSRLFPTLQKYIQQRQALEGISEDQVEATDEPTSRSTTVEGVDVSTHVHANGQSRSNGSLTMEALSRRVHDASFHPSPRMSTPSSLPPESQKDPETTRELLSHVACISEELLRASQEKVNLAQANHDSVERHIRLIDQAIQEQVASLSLEKSRLTTGMAVHLPEVVVPEWPRKNPNSYLSDDELDIIDGDQPPFAPEKKIGRPKGPQRKKKGKERNKAGQDDQSKDSIPLTITLPATTQQDAIDVQLNEELYCYCNRVSFGEMIACDNESCEREWFHLGCVGLTEIPEGEWYCEDCRDEES